MAEREKQYMPQSTAGLMRYFEGEEKIKLNPMHIVFMGLAFGVVVMVLKFFA